MADAEQKSYARTTTTAESPGRSSSVGLGPGKETLVEREFAAIQRRASMAGSGGEEAAVHAAAARGTATASSPLPYADTLQRAFGRHDISSVQAHTGSDAATSARDMGADAYATGNHVVLGQCTDLATVAHEAAHVVQQRGGVQLKGGVGNEGDRHERHADEVASMVVQGKSAEGLLDQYASGSASVSAPGATPTQRKLSVGGADQDSVEAVWAQIEKDPRLQGIESEAKALLQQWIENKAQYPEDSTKESSNRHYGSYDLLISALAGDVKAAGNLAHEGDLAKQAIDEGHINDVLGTIVAKLKAFQDENSEALPSTENSGRYGDWTYPKAKMSDAVQADPGTLKGRIAMIADYALAVKGDVPKKRWKFQMAAEHGEARPEQRGNTNANEASAWVQDARTNNMPVSAGPSATTAQVLALAELLGCSVEDKTALAWALFALWNDMPLHLTGTHRFHEVMDVAALHGVPYQQFQYSDPPKPAKT